MLVGMYLSNTELLKKINGEIEELQGELKTTS